MSRFKDILGTVLGSFQIGLKTATVQARSLIFRSQFTGTLTWSPTAPRTATIPDKTGTIAFVDDLAALRNEVSMIGAPFNNTSAANTAAVITVPAPGSGFRLNLYQLSFGYSGTPTNGLLTVQQGATTIYRLPITSSGAGPVVAGIKLAANTAMTITLSAGGDGVTGDINASVETLEG